MDEDEADIVSMTMARMVLSHLSLSYTHDLKKKKNWPLERTDRSVQHFVTYGNVIWVLHAPAFIGCDSFIFHGEIPPQLLLCQ